jgi:MinD-like ATPase involved in chromosome partitioning or flagellar assembly
LEAGGLHTIFGLRSENIPYTLLDLLTVFPTPDAVSTVIDLTNQLPPSDTNGKLWLLPTVSEAEKLSKVLEVGRDIPMLLGGIIDEITNLYRPHYILVDSRSGFAELASAPILKADRLVCVLRPNRQNADGLRILLDILEMLPRSPATFLVISQVPDVPEAVTKVNDLQSMLGMGRHFGTSIPYAPELALEETVAALVEPTSSLAQCYRPIVNWLEKSLP